jgi:hypothetical protein
MRRDVAHSGIETDRTYLERLLASPFYPFDSGLRSALPEKPANQTRFTCKDRQLSKLVSSFLLW